MTRRHLARLLFLTAVAAALGCVAWSYSTDGIVALLFAQDLTADDKLDTLRKWFNGFGPAAPLAYFTFVTVEVVIAPIPGTMLYAPGGAIFGGFWGGLLSLLGNVVGAGIACQFVRFTGGERARQFLSRTALGAHEEQIARRGAWVIFLLRVNPLTSSDLVSYAAGFTRISVAKVMLGTLFGMAPLCFAQSYLSESILSAFPRLLYPLLAACAAYSVLVIAVLAKLAARPAQRALRPTAD